MLIGLSAQRLIGCAYRLFSLGLCPGACVPVLIGQSARGLAKEAGLGGCADRGDGAQFLSKSTLFKFTAIFLVRPANGRELRAQFQDLGHAVLHESPLDVGHALWSDLRQYGPLAGRGQ